MSMVNHIVLLLHTMAVWWNSIQRKQRTMVGCIEEGLMLKNIHYKHEQAKRVYHQEEKHLHY